MYVSKSAFTDLSGRGVDETPGFFCKVQEEWINQLKKAFESVFDYLLANSFLYILLGNLKVFLHIS